MIFTVCDGMGGHVAGQVASKIAVESILQYLNANKYVITSYSIHYTKLYDGIFAA